MQSFGQIKYRVRKKLQQLKENFLKKRKKKRKKKKEDVRKDFMECTILIDVVA